MSCAQCSRWLIAALMAAATPAYAFNPQPDPPARMLNSNTFSNQKTFNQKTFNSDRAVIDKKNGVPLGICKIGTSCKAGTTR